MDQLVLAPNNRWLYILNYVRQDIVRLDLTGVSAAIDASRVPLLSLRMAVSHDNSTVYVSDGVHRIAVFDAALATQIGWLPVVALTMASAPDNHLYTLETGRGFAQLRVFGKRGGGGRLLAVFKGNVLADRKATLAFSPDGRRVYVLWDGLRAVDAHSGRVLGMIRLPLSPAYSGMSVAPNGQQAMLWAPDFGGWAESPTSNPHMILVHFGFVAGGILPVDLVHMRPIVAHLNRMGTPRSVVYSADSRSAVVSQLTEVDLLRIGTSGRSSTVLPHFSLANPWSVAHRSAPAMATATSGPSSNPPTATSGPSSNPTAPPAPSPTTGTTSSCTTWNVSGAWTFQGDTVTTQNGQATLQQSGSTVSGTLTEGGVTWTLSGSISGSTLTLTWSAAGQVDQYYTGTISSDGSTITGSTLGIFTGGHAQCLQ
jgi:hypothetical protein